MKGLKEIQVTFVKTSYYYHTSHQHVSIKCAPILKIQKKNCITFKKRDKGNIILYSYSWNFIKKETPQSVFLWILRNLYENLFYKKNLNNCFELLQKDPYQEFISYTLHDLNNHFILQIS